MTTTEASRLLRDYASCGSEDAFRRLVEGHANLVEGTARRQLNGDAALVKDVAQIVFASLAANPRAVRGTSVAAWLQRVTVRRATDVVRSESRRRHREHAALACPDSEAVMPHHDDFWEHATPAVDAALDRLPQQDRAILLERFWQRQGLRAIGAARGLTGNAVQKRIARSLERLRCELERRGIRGSGSLLSVSLGAALVHSGGGATAQAAGLSLVQTSTPILHQIIAMTLTQKFLTGAAVLVLAALPVYQQTRINSLKDELAAALPGTKRAKAHRTESPVAAATAAAQTPAVSPKARPGAAPKDYAAAADGDVVARVIIPGPGEAVFTRRGNAVVLDSFRVADDPAAGGGIDSLALASGLGEDYSQRAPQTTAGHIHWDHAQATGAPDTTTAGDRPTAWAPRSPKSGEQWLQLGYNKPVEIREVNVHESYNSGAISKVTAFLPDGTEKTLWSGTHAPGAAGEILETSLPVPPGTTSSRIKVYLDTNRVESWPEIDAVELVGTDGSRQWAAKSSASSSYSENYPDPGMIENEGGLEKTTRTRNLGQRSADAVPAPGGSPGTPANPASP